MDRNNRRRSKPLVDTSNYFYDNLPLQAPAVYDSSGLLHIMANFGKPGMGTWARVLDTNALERQQGAAFKQESYWPIGANQHIFSCIIVKVCHVWLDSNTPFSLLTSLGRGRPLTPGSRGRSLPICQCGCHSVVVEATILRYQWIRCTKNSESRTIAV